MITKDVRCEHGMKSRIAHGKSGTQQEEDCFHQQIGLKLRQKLVECYVWSITLCGAETWTLGK